MKVILTILHRLLWVFEVGVVIIPLGIYFMLLTDDALTEGKEVIAFLMLVGCQVVFIGLVHFIITAPIGQKLKEEDR